MAEAPRGFGEQLFQRLQGQGLSSARIYKALALQRLADEVVELGAQGKLEEAALVEISKIKSPARQKLLADLAVRTGLNPAWVKEVGRLIRNAEKTSSDRESNKYWDFYFEVNALLEREGATPALLERVKHFTVDQADALEVSDRRVVDFRKFDLVPGRGLDVGTSNICASARTTDGKTIYNIQRNAFLDVRSDTFTRKMLMKLGVDHITTGEKGYVIGDAAFELANIFEKNTRRPMKDGMISPVEQEALTIVGLIIGQLLGPPKHEGEICSFSIPADPIDADRNVIYHRGALEAILRKLGYDPKPILEGHCVVLGEMAEDDYTGIGISCGAGMFNISIAYKSVPALTFSTSRGGDWIDNNVAHALGLPSSQVCAIKESGVDLNHPRDRVEDAICIYYRNLIQYALSTIRQKFETAHNMPAFPGPIPVVCAGGTSMVKGFIDVFRDEFRKVNMPIEVKDIHLARDPLRTVALGGLVDAIEETKARGRVEKDGTFNMTRADIAKVTTMDLSAHMRRDGPAPVSIPRSEPSKIEAAAPLPKVSMPGPQAPRPDAVTVQPFEMPKPRPAEAVPAGRPEQVTVKPFEMPKRPVAPPPAPAAAKVEPFTVPQIRVPEPPAPKEEAPPKPTWKMPTLPPAGFSGSRSEPAEAPPETPAISARIKSLPLAGDKPGAERGTGFRPSEGPRGKTVVPPPSRPADEARVAPVEPVDEARGKAPKPSISGAAQTKPGGKPSDTDFSEWKGMLNEIGDGKAGAAPPAETPPTKDPRKDTKRKEGKPGGREDFPLFS